MILKKMFVSCLVILNVLSGGIWLAFTLRGHYLASEQGYNYSAQRWDDDGGYTQVSCYFTDDSKFTADDIPGVKITLEKKARDAGAVPKENAVFIPNAYSTELGEMDAKCDTLGRSKVQVTAVGGDFFLFRDFSLTDGAFFSESDIMQDGAVIDRRLAFSLYGSVNVAGMNIYINGTKFYISGVIEDPKTDAEKKTAGETPRAYISYDGANLINSGQKTITADEGGENGGITENTTETELKRVTCYECIVPNPVENYAYNAVKEYFDESYENKYMIVNNTERFKPSALAKRYKKLSDYAVADVAINYPYWENASRLTEFKLAKIYFYRRYTYIILAVTLIILIIGLYRIIGRIGQKLILKAKETINNTIYKVKQKIK